MEFQLRKWDVNELNIVSSKNEEQTNSFDLSYKSQIDNNDKKLLIVRFKIEVLSSRFRLRLDISYIFGCTEEIDEQEEMTNSLINVNVPAIAFPFIRAYISTVTLQSGFSPVLLPSINFYRLAEKMKENK